MVTKQASVSVAANATNANILSDSRLEFAPESGEIAVYVTGSALGLNIRGIISGEEVIESSEINAQNRLPVVPDDLLQSDIRVGEGEKVQLEVANTTIGALTVFYRVELVGDADVELAMQ